METEAKPVEVWGFLSNEARDNHDTSKGILIVTATTEEEFHRLADYTRSDGYNSLAYRCEGRWLWDYSEAEYAVAGRPYNRAEVARLFNRRDDFAIEV
jgi:hypothetical protein